MGTKKQKQHLNCSSDTAPNTGSAYTPAPRTTSSVASDPSLGYKIRVLLQDFLHVTKDVNAERRMNQTTDEHYISLPYFSVAEATIIKAAIVDIDLGKKAESASMNTGYGEEENSNTLAAGEHEDLKGRTFDEVVRVVLNSFIDKRRASGDARPCGPHHLAPLYAALFGLNLGEIESENFLRRLRRAGV